jgi:putative transport protein
MDAIQHLLENSPLLTLFLVIGLGYALGEVSIKGFSLGVGAVLFVGLAAGALAPRSAPPDLVGTLGLVMFLYGIGIQYGKHFFAGFGSAAGLRFNLLALLALLAGLLVVVATLSLTSLPATYVAGLFTGSMTSTAALKAAMEAAGNGDPALGYSVAYPFGVIGPILLSKL